MQILSQISPAATLLLLTTSARMRGLLKLTLMDLILKGVLHLDVKGQKLEEARRTIAVWYVSPGRNFNMYRPKPYELVFIQPFFEDKDIRIPFRDVVRVGFRNARGIDVFKHSVIKTDGIGKYVKRSFLQRIYGGHSMTREGKELQQELKQYFSRLNKSIAFTLQNDKKQALEIIMNLRGNCLLVRNLKFQMLGGIDFELLKQHYDFVYPDDWEFYESMFEESKWLDYFDLSVDVFDESWDDMWVSDNDVLDYP